jgi:hypothetical protein
MHGIGPAIACFPDIAGSTNASPLHDPGPTTSSKQLDGRTKLLWKVQQARKSTADAHR